MEENSEQQAEMAKAVLEALGNGGMDGLKRMIDKLEPKRSDSEHRSETPRRVEAQAMDLQTVTPQGSMFTPKQVASGVVKTEVSLLALQARPSRHLESPAPLTEVGSGYFSRDQANLVPVGDGANFKAVTSATNRGSASKDKEHAKLGRPGYDYSDYFAPESWRTCSESSAIARWPSQVRTKWSFGSSARPLGYMSSTRTSGSAATMGSTSELWSAMPATPRRRSHTCAG